MNVTVKHNGGAHVIELANRATVQKLDGETISAITARQDNHESGLNTNAHGVSNIAGLQSTLDGKSDVGHGHSIADVTWLQAALDGKADLFTGYSGSITVVKTVDFAAQSVTTATINISNGIIVSIT